MKKILFITTIALGYALTSKAQVSQCFEQADDSSITCKADTTGAVGNYIETNSDLTISDSIYHSHFSEKILSLYQQMLDLCEKENQYFFANMVKFEANEFWKTHPNEVYVVDDDYNTPRNNSVYIDWLIRFIRKQKISNPYQDLINTIK